MSLAAGPNKTIYAGDGVTTAFPITFPLPTGSTGSDVVPVVFDDLGNMTLLTGNYSVDLATLRVNYPTVGGVAPLAPGVMALPINWQIVLVRIEALSQLLRLKEQGTFSAAAIEAGFDYLTMICQQLQEQINRAALVPINTPGPATPVVAPTVGGVGLVQINGTWAQLVAISQLNPTQQFLGFVTSGDMAGQGFFYSGNVLLGNQGFLGAWGG